MVPVGCSLTDDQAGILDYLLEAAAGQVTATFHCGRMIRIPFAWVIHANVIDDACVTHWDDLLALHNKRLIELRPGDEPDVCTFVLTELAYAACSADSPNSVTTLPVVPHTTGHNEAPPV